MKLLNLLLVTLLPTTILGSPIVRRNLKPSKRQSSRATNQVFNGPLWNSTALSSPNCTCITTPSNSTGQFSNTTGIYANLTSTPGTSNLCPTPLNGSDVYNMYTGDGSSAAGWPSINQWASFDYLWAQNQDLIANSCVNIGSGGPNNSPNETATVGQMIQAVAADSNVDPRFILAVMMQESKGCVRVQTTYGSNCNPGLMQDHCGPSTCWGVNPCPASTIYGMLQDGVGGTVAGDGLAAIMDQLSNGTLPVDIQDGPATGMAQLYYRTARMYNSGSVDPSGNLGLGVATKCYASDIANRLMGWVFATSTCYLD